MVACFARRGNCGDERKGDAGSMDLFGSNANERASDVPVRLASVIELSRDCGPNEKDDPIECLGRELDGDVRLGIDGIANPD